MKDEMIKWEGIRYADDTEYLKRKKQIEDAYIQSVKYELERRRIIKRNETIIGFIWVITLIIIIIFHNSISMIHLF